jgi:hypothetical protein
VDSFSARIKPEAKAAAEEEEEEGIGDVDLFALAGDGGALTVNAKWLQHLQARRPLRAPWLRGRAAGSAAPGARRPVRLVRASAEHWQPAALRRRLG